MDGPGLENAQISISDLSGGMFAVPVTFIKNSRMESTRPSLSRGVYFVTVIQNGNASTKK